MNHDNIHIWELCFNGLLQRTGNVQPVLIVDRDHLLVLSDRR